ncbi:hypothetical protein N0V94_005438 [Neodidymelliopsis sp. IMI 364377]|nr:hypothetical protein N0V94_005438 [Neodidymelliopsis sp. IMI 364377]
MAQKVFEYAKASLPERTFNHSMRVWNYGNAIVQTHFPHLTPILDTYFLTCLFHDIGTTPKHMEGTHLSFEYWGAIKARTFLGEHGAPSDQADAVCEAIIRHAELGETGMITSLGLLIQLTTSFAASNRRVLSETGNSIRVTRAASTASILDLRLNNRISKFLSWPPPVPAVDCRTFRVRHALGA